MLLNCASSAIGSTPSAFITALTMESDVIAVAAAKNIFFMKFLLGYGDRIPPTKQWTPHTVQYSITKE
jgi:hypothetical protein